MNDQSTTIVCPKPGSFFMRVFSRTFSFEGLKVLIFDQLEITQKKIECVQNEIDRYENGIKSCSFLKVYCKQELKDCLSDDQLFALYQTSIANLQGKIQSYQFELDNLKKELFEHISTKDQLEEDLKSLNNNSLGNIPSDYNRCYFVTSLAILLDLIVCEGWPEQEEQARHNDVVPMSYRNR